MTEVILSNRALIMFDGKVVEFFMSDGTARRYHVAHVSTIKMKTNQSGQYRLELRTVTDAVEAEEVDGDRVDSVMGLVEAVLTAMGVYQ